MEYAFKAAGGNITGVSCRGKDSVCLVTQKKIPERLIDPTSVTSIYSITPKIGCLATGLTADCKAAITRVRYEASDFQYKYGYAIPVHVLAKRVADLNQVRTQSSGLRILAATLTLISVDEEKGPQIHKVDPSGHFLPYKATASGLKEQEAANYFEKKVEGERKREKKREAASAFLLFVL